MRKEEFYFDSRDGINKIHAVRYLPDTDNVKCVVQIIHGMAEYVERYEAFAQFLTDRGCVVTGEDHLGHGKSVPSGGTYGYFCEQDPATVVVRDAHRLKKMTQQVYPNLPYIIMGHSMGSFIARNYLCRYGKGISGAIIMGTGMQPLLLLKVAKMIVAIQKLFFGSTHTSNLLNKMASGSYQKRLPEARTNYDWLSRVDEQVDRYIADPLCGFVFTLNGFGTLFTLIERLHKREYLENVPKDLPVFMVSGAEDPVGDYGKGVKAAFESLKNVGLQNISMKLYEQDRHELLNEKDSDVVMQDLYKWICSTTGIQS